MPDHPRAPRAAAVLVAALALGACSAGAAAPTDGASPSVPPAAAADPPSVATVPTDPDPVAGPHEVVLVADLGDRPDGSGRILVTTTWVTDATGTVRLTVDTPAGPAARHVLTSDEHWWWLHPEVRAEFGDVEWVRFDLAAIDRAGGALPDVVAEARRPPPQPHELQVGQVVAGREVLDVAVVDEHEVHLTVAGIEAPVVHRRRPLPAGTRVDPPTGAVDVADLPELLVG